GLYPYKVVVSDLNGCKDSASFTIQTMPLPTRELLPKIRICPGQDTILDAGTSNGSVGIWKWHKNPAAPVMSDSISQRIMPNDSGLYTVKKIDLHGCVMWDTTRFYVNNVVPIDAGPDKIICFNDPLLKIRASGSTANIDSYKWSNLA